jgi:CheY-like chemotaxis protein
MATTASANRPRILLVDDDQDFLEAYREVLQLLPSHPEVHTASTGNRALAMLESEMFGLLIVDLQMPRMDGLQVLSIARRKFPQLRIVVLTGINDDEFRVRAYGMGVDQFWQKAHSEKEIHLFKEAMESLLRRENQIGFRGIQSKSLVDILQFESLSQTSGVLKVINGVLEGRIWLQTGSVIDSETQELTGEDAFKSILSWHTGSFEMLPPDESRERRIFSSCQALLLETAQAMDEARDVSARPEDGGDAGADKSPLAELTRSPDVQFVLSITQGSPYQIDSWGVECPDVFADWCQKSMLGFEALGERLQAGRLQQVSGLGAPTNVVMAGAVRGFLTVGFRSALDEESLREDMRNLLAKWVS